MSDANDLLVLRGIHKSFPGVRALAGVDFSLRRGEIHALLGENGAGKSTLIKTATGVERPDQGEILLEGKPIQPRSPQHAQDLGISTVYQEVNLCPNLSVAENIFIGREPKKWGRIDWKTMNRRASEILQRMNLDVDVTRMLGDYSIAIQQMAAIARALNIQAKALILDEPTSSLDAHEVQTLFDGMRRLKAEGLGIVFITHFIDQVYEITDRITVLRNGELVGTYETALLPRLALIQKMIGKELERLVGLAAERGAADGDQQEGTGAVVGKTLIEARGLGQAGAAEPFDLVLHGGEVLGLAGLLGSGRTEIARLLFGAAHADTGTLAVGGKAMRNPSPLHSLLNGVALCPEDRKTDGVIGELTVRENIILALQAGRGWFRYLPPAKQAEIADEFIRTLNISTPSSEQLVRNLSGGNQQKVILARWLATNASALILDEPTRGIDIGAKAEIQKLILLLAKEGRGMVFISSELDEVVRCADRVAVMRDHAMVAELSGGQVNQSAIMNAIAGEA